VPDDRPDATREYVVLGACLCRVYASVRCPERVRMANVRFALKQWSRVCNGVFLLSANS
jgi:hypothetical protein